MGKGKAAMWVHLKSVCDAQVEFLLECRLAALVPHLGNCRCGLFGVVPGRDYGKLDAGARLEGNRQVTKLGQIGKVYVSPIFQVRGVLCVHSLLLKTGFVFPHLHFVESLDFMHRI